MKTCWITYYLNVGRHIFRGDAVLEMPDGRLTASFLKDAKVSLKKAIIAQLETQWGAFPEEKDEVLILACIPLDEEKPAPVTVPITEDTWDNPEDSL